PFGDHEIPENLDFLRRLQLLRIDEVNRQLGKLQFGQYGYDVTFLLSEVIRDHTNADAGADRVLECQNGARAHDRYPGCAPLASDRFEKIDVREVGRRIADEGDDPVAVEISDARRRAELSDVLAGGVAVRRHGEERPSDEVALRGLPRPDGDVGHARGEIHLLVIEDELHADVWIELEELAQALVNPDRAEADRRRDAEVAGR